MTERMQSYIGVSGVVSPEQQAEIVEMAGGELEDRSHVLALGVKATHKPQYENTENKYGRNWYPVGDEITTALDYHTRTFNIAQMYYEPEALAADPLYARSFTNQVASRTREYIDALQVDMLRFDTDPDAARQVLKAMAATGLRTIVQCHGFAMANGPTQALESLKRAADGAQVDYILFDASHGRGIDMNPDELLPFIDAAYNDRYFMSTMTNFGVAGGLNGDTVDALLGKIVQIYPEISWDAEGKLHDAIPEGGDGSLNMSRVQQYLHRSASILGTYF